MKRRHLLAAGGALLASGVSSAKAAMQCAFVGPGVQRCEVGAPSFMFQPAAQQQYRSQWCWAASLAMLFAYYGRPVSQARIVAETWGQIVDLPGRPDQILADINRPWRDDRGRSFGVVGDVLSANVATAIDDLAQGNPLLIGALGHCMVLTAGAFLRDVYGATALQSLTVRDPWPLSPNLRLLTPQEFANVSFLARVRVF